MFPEPRKRGRPSEEGTNLAAAVIVAEEPVPECPKEDDLDQLVLYSQSVDSKYASSDMSTMYRSLSEEDDFTFVRLHFV